MTLTERIQQVLQEYDYSGASIGLLTLSICLTIEIISQPFKSTSLYKLLNPTKSVLTDIIIGPLYMLGVFSLIKSILVYEPNLVPAEYQINTLVKSPTLQFVIYFIIVDFLHYWIHRISHKIEFLWQLHKFHHSATDFVLLTGNRIHPLERVFQRLITFIPLKLLGSPPEMYLGIIILIGIIDVMQHSQIDWNLGWVGRNIFFSPIGHRIHHSQDREHWDKNFGDIFVFWDKLFGTYYSGSNINRAIGVTENWYNEKGIIHDLALSVWLSLKEFKSSLITWNWKAKHLR